MLEAVLQRQPEDELYSGNGDPLNKDLRVIVLHKLVTDVEC